MTEYKSVEQRIGDNIRSGVEKGIGYLEFVGVGDFVRAFYGTTASFFRFPTVIRKLVKNQTWMNRTKSGEYLLPQLVIGGLFGGILSSGFSYFALTQVNKQNYIPLAVLAATNLASGMFELGKLSGKKESLEAKVVSGGS